jgi:hypothetical protein
METIIPSSMLMEPSTAKNAASHVARMAETWDSAPSMPATTALPPIPAMEIPKMPGPDTFSSILHPETPAKQEKPEKQEEKQEEKPEKQDRDREIVLDNIAKLKTAHSRLQAIMREIPARKGDRVLQAATEALGCALDCIRILERNR